MVEFTIRRLLSSIPTVFILAALTFFLLRLAPGGPFDGEKAWPPEIKANIEARYGLDRPLTHQFFSWCQDVFRGDLRESFQYIGKPVREIISESLPVSFLIGLGGLVLALLVGVPLGAFAAWKQNSFWDYSVLFLAVSGVSLPNYLLASVLVSLFAIQLQWFPAALWDEPTAMILPILTLAARPAAMIARLVRSSMMEVLRAPYIQVARAKGLSARSIVLKHSLRNSLIPLFSLLGPLTANLVTGSFVVELIFQLPGMGKYFVSSVLNRDYPLVMGITLTYGAFLISANFIVDLSYAWIDPRIRLGRQDEEPT